MFQTFKRMTSCDTLDMRDYEFYVYILRCCDGSLYTGVTNNLERRLKEHNSGFDLRSYTFSRRPVTIVYACFFQYIHEAIAWEKHIKRWSRRKKEALIREDEEALKLLSKKDFTEYRKRHSQQQNDTSPRTTR